MKKFKLIIIINNLFKAVLAALVSTLILDICFWLNAALNHKPLDRSAWLKLYDYLLDYRYCETSDEYILQTICLTCIIALHISLFFLTWIVIRKFTDKYFAQ
ncbi:MAG: hypothetical protein KGL19_12605 [Bacteroidota bacterium]|nr:hypothetical protein [Bacteroidota bacterium]